MRSLQKSGVKSFFSGCAGDLCHTACTAQLDSCGIRQSIVDWLAAAPPWNNGDETPD
jgi:hypothetical protein